MIGNFLSRFFRGTATGRRISYSKNRARRIAIEPLESRRLLAVTGSISGYALLPNGAGFPGLTVQLSSVDSQGNLSSVSGVGPMQTASDGSYSFTGLSAGSYEVELTASSKLAMGMPSAGSAGGTDGTNDIQLTLAAGQSATDYNFSVLGAQTDEISLRMFLASTGSLSQFLTSLHTPPTVDPGASGAATNSATYTTGGSAAAVAAPSATITAPDSPTLTSMSVTIENPLDGSSEKLSATTSGGLTSNFANDVLTVSGVADLATYETVLQSVLYSDSAATATAGNRTISIVVNDGTDASAAATSTITVVQGTQTVPTVTSVSPSSGPASGGTVVTIDGSGFTAASTVNFGTTAATNVTFVSATQISATAPAGAGLVDVTVTTASETSATSSSDQFSYVPSVTSVSPSSGPTSGGTVVTIDGSGFTSAATVKFGTAAATNVTYVSATQITAAAPAGTGSGVDITVTTAGGTSATSSSDQFSYAPSVTSVSPNSGLASGGTVVTINGSGFTNGSTVDFGTTAATSVTFVSATQITATAPAGTAGALNITVTTAGETSATSSSDQFTYLPGVTGISPSSGPAGGGTVVTINGSGFTNASTVAFGATAATGVTLVSTTQITATAPAGAGLVDVTVTTAGATSATSSSDQFTYVPSVTSVSPSSGLAGGGTSVTIVGSGFTAASTVKFGTTAATNVTFVSATQLTATAPAGTAGGVDVTVTTAGQTSATSSSDQFSYVPTVASVSPNSGLASGGTVVTINGSGFTNGSTVEFGTTAATNVTFVSATQITATAPAGTVGTVNIIVTTAGEISATSSNDQFSYLPGVTSVSPNSGPASGGTVVTINGSGFTAASTVRFGAAAATGVTFVSATQLTATAPAGAGLVDITVTTAGETSGTSTSDQFTYLPSVVSVSPSLGPASGGSVVTLQGSGFTAASTVEFGTTAATDVTFVSATQITATAPAGAVGTVDITVTTAGKTSATSSSDQFTYVPSVTSVSPSSGLASGGTVVTIHGSGFTNASTVAFGATAATGVTFVSATQITATAPAGTVGTVNITVTTAGETSVASANDQFSYLPGVTSVSPSSGPSSGGTVVTINGSGFTAASTVRFGAAAATGVTFVSATQLTATAPAGAGLVDITVTTAGETSATSSSDQFTYLPSVTSVSPSSGPAGGGTMVTIQGSGFTAASTVKFGSVSATNVTFVSATQITASAPAGTVGVVDVTVATAGETSATSSSDQFTYVPSVTSVSPNSGPAGGGTVVTINGSGFSASSTVEFGTMAATGVTEISSTQITATAPASTVGAVDITVITAGETSATSSHDQFTYLPTVTSVSPSSGPASGGTVVTIDGTGFTAASTVKFGTAEATGVTFVSATQITATAPAGAGLVDITVTSSGETSAASSDDQFSYVPSVTSVGQGSGPSGAGSVVTINGTGFTAASTVKFGTVAASSVTFVSATQLTATAPNGAGVVDITVTTGGETSATSSNDEFAYTPTVTSISPSSGPASGGTVVTINGTGFTAASTVEFGTNAATNVTIVSQTQISATAPAGTVGTVDVTVNTVGGTSATSSHDQFGYLPSVTSVSPNSGPNSGGTVVTINGMGFTAASTVKFGTVAATNVTFVSATQLTATAPAGGGSVDVTVTTAGETSATSSSDQFTYTAGITADQSILGPANDTAAGFTIHGGVSGETFTYSAQSSGGSGTVTGSGTLTGATQDVTGINVSALPAGTLTYTVTLSGSPGTPLTATASLKIAPSGYSVSPSLSTYNGLTATAASFTFSGAMAGDTYNYTITSNNGGTPVTGSGAVTSATQTVSGIDLINSQNGNVPLANGTLTFSVTLTDAGGNVGAAATATASIDTTAVPKFTVTPSETTYTPANDTNAGFTISNADVGTTYTYNFLLKGVNVGITGSGMVTAASMPVSGIDLSSLPSGKYTLHVVESDSVGNANNSDAQFTLNKPIPAFSITANLADIGAPTATNTGFTFAGAPTNSTYTYTVTSTGGAGSVIGSGSVSSATQVVSGIDVSKLPSGTITYSVTLTDGAGNVSSPVTTTAVLQTVAPSGYSFTPDQSTFNATTVKNAGFTFINATVNDEYVYEVAGLSASTGGNGMVTSPTEHVGGIDLSSFPDGSYTLTVILKDAENNVGPIEQATINVDTVLPSGYSITADQSVIGPSAVASAGFTFSGATVNDHYNYTITSSGGSGSVTGSGVVSSATQDVTPINVSTLPDGKLTYSVTLTSPDGNTGAAVTATTVLNQFPPTGYTVTPDESVIDATAAASTGFTLAGALPGDTYSYSVSQNGGTVIPAPVTGSGTVTADTQHIGGINLSSFANGSVTFSVTLTNAAGNAGNPATASATLDTNQPAAIALSTSVVPSDQAAGTEVGLLETIGPQSTASYTYSLVSGGADNGSFQINGNELVTGAMFSSGGQSTFNIMVRSTDALGNFIDEPFQLTLANSDPVSPTLTLGNSSVASGQAAGTIVGTLNTTGPVLGSQVNYSLVSGTGSDDNSSFQIVNGQLVTTGPLPAGSYMVRVRSSSTYLLSDVVDLNGVSGPTAYQVTFDPSQLPSSVAEQVAASAGLISLMSNSGSGWNAAVTTNKAAPGSQAVPNFQGSYASFIASVGAAPLANLVGSSGVDQSANGAWAVIDQAGEYAVGVQVYTEQTFMITVT
jgi:large repetitive protein